MAALRVNPVDIRQNRYAVVIGINKYRDPAISNLEYARADAEAVYRVLTDPQLGRIPKENVILLLDEAATQREIRKAVGTTLKQKAGEEDVVYIYYAGHGAPEIDPKSKSSDGLEKYLVPHDGEAEDLFSSAISMEEIRRFFERLIARQVIFFIDSCYSGEAGGRTFPDPRYRSRHLSGEFLENLAGEGRLVITACHVSEVSLELSALQHGLFTYHLLEGMRGKADQDGDGRVSIDELYQYLYRNVSEEARRLNGSMRPVRKGTAVGDLYITRYETAAQKEAEQLRPPAREAARRGEFPKALQAWRKIRQLLPGDEEANRFISAIEQKQREAEEQKQRLLERRQAALLEYYQSGELSAEAFDRAMELLPRESALLTETERRIHKLLADLADGRISLPVYRSSIALIDKGLADTPKTTPEKKSTAAPPPATEPLHRQETAAAKEKPVIIESPKVEPPSWKAPSPRKRPEWPGKSVYKKWLGIAGAAIATMILIYVVTNMGGKKEEASLQSQNESTASSYDTVSIVGMIRIPGGTFQMGSTEGDDDEKPVHEVVVSDFYLGKYEVTVGDFRKFVNATGYRTEAEKGDGAYVYEGTEWKKKSDANWKNPYFTQSDDHPVVCVSWNDAVEYCNWRSRQEGLTPCYSGSGDNIACNFSANGYRLPTEAEWEYAAREKGKNVRFGNGKNIADPREINFDGRESYKQSYSVAGEYRGKTTPVGNFPSNALELYDMSGNVWEWCWDWYGSKYYEQRVKQSPEGPSNGSVRVLRGGSWGRPEERSVWRSPLQQSRFSRLQFRFSSFADFLSFALCAFTFFFFCFFFSFSKRKKEVFLIFYFFSFEGLWIKKIPKPPPL